MSHSIADTTINVTAGVAPSTAHTVVGIALAALLPALFWPLTLAAALSLVGVEFSATAQVMCGASIALFLAAIVTPIMINSDAAATN